MPSGVEWRAVDWCRGWSLHPAALWRRVTLNCDDARSAVKELINVAVPRSWPHATYKHTFPILFGWVAADWIAKGKMGGLWRVYTRPTHPLDLWRRCAEQALWRFIHCAATLSLLTRITFHQQEYRFCIQQNTYFPYNLSDNSLGYWTYNIIIKITTDNVSLQQENLKL